ncbi:MAG: adenylyltransferase/cytidyltransferase family protein [Bacteroidaceae bacterium]|nr:adenylyltransferase/cytidyltransferase family protein [Bacteroidaceae bacterium]
MAKKVFVSGCYDLLHSGHVEFFRQAAEYGDLYVGIGSDKTIEGYKHHKTIYSEQERLFMVKSIRYVKDAFINAGSGVMDFLPTLDIVKPDILVVNEDGGNDEKRRVCEERGIQYVVLQRVPQEGLTARSSTDLKKTESRIPTRLDLAGTWIDQPYVSQYAPGWAITISLEPTFEVRERCGLSTSTRNMIKKIWPYQLPNMDPEILAKLVFCFENDPERSDGIISGAQDSIGICIPGLCRHYYNNRFWPEKIETCQDEAVLSWLESHLVMIPMEPRRPGCSVVEGKDITEPKVKALAKAADDCWNAIMAKDLKAFAAAYQASFEAQVAMFPGMVHPSLKFKVDSLKSVQEVQSSRVQEYIDKWSKVPGVLAYKMPGAGGGGYLACVVEDAEAFCNDPSTPSAGSGTGSGQENEKPIRLSIRRPGM